MDTVGRVSRMQAGDRVIERHLLGLGVLLVTFSTGYFLSGFSGSRELPAEARPTQVARVEAAPVESAPTPPPAPTSIETDGEVDLDTYIKRVAARYDVPADL